MADKNTGHQPLKEIVTYCDDACPFACPRQQVDGNAKYLKIVVRTYGEVPGEFTDETIFVGEKFKDGSEHRDNEDVICHCPRCEKDFLKKHAKE